MKATLHLNRLEDRDVPAVITVTSAADSGAGTLREAIIKANSTNAADTIRFALPGTGVRTITLATALPEITKPLTIDGDSQDPRTRTPDVELNGLSTPAASAGLVLKAGGSTIRGLIINRFPGNGIEVSGPGRNQISGNFIGTDATGSIDLGNGGAGLTVVNSSRNVVTFNLISGNDGEGISLVGTGTNRNAIRGNAIGTDGTGRFDLGNSLVGIGLFDGSGNNTIGGTSVSDGNLVSGNDQTGIFAFGGGSNAIQNNYVGTDVTGHADLGNGFQGIAMLNSPDNRIVRNLVSGNGANGVAIGGGASTNNLVQANRIGTDIDGLTAIANGFSGMYIGDGSGFLPPAPGSATQTTVERNVISGNVFDGITLRGIGADRTQINNNRIGTTAGANPTALSNGRHGLTIDSGASQNNVRDNAIAFNLGIGVRVGLSAADTAIGNRIEMNAIHSNGLIGIDLGNDGLTENDANDADTGPNGYQNFVTNLQTERTQTVLTRVKGLARGKPFSEVIVTFYANATVDPSGRGEGERPLVVTPFAIVVPIGADGTGQFSVATVAVPVTPTEAITALATSVDGTSEFSARDSVLFVG